MDVLIDLGRIDVDMDLPGSGCELLGVTGDPVVEPAPYGDDQVGLVERQARPRDTVHAGHAERQHVAARERADTEQGCDDRDLRLLGERLQLLEGVRDRHAVAGENHRAFGRVDELGRLLDRRLVALARRDVAGEVYRFRPDELCGLLEDVTWNINQHRTGPAGAGDVEGFLDRPGDVRCVHHEEVVLGYR